MTWLACVFLLIGGDPKLVSPVKGIHSAGDCPALSGVVYAGLRSLYRKMSDQMLDPSQTVPGWHSALCEGQEFPVQFGRKEGG